MYIVGGLVVNNTISYDELPFAHPIGLPSAAPLGGWGDDCRVQREDGSAWHADPVYAFPVKVVEMGVVGT
jgi:hypothetical protein